MRESILQERKNAVLVNITCDDEENLRYVDIIMIPDEVAENLDQVVNEFFNWMFDKSNDHKYWVREDGKKKYCSYTSEAFVDWFNKFLAKEEKAAIIAVSSEQIDDTLPILYF